MELEVRNAKSIAVDLAVISFTLMSGCSVFVSFDCVRMLSNSGE